VALGVLGTLTVIMAAVIGAATLAQSL